MGYYSTQRELARHDSRAHVQQLTMFSTIPECFECHATRDVNIIHPVHPLSCGLVERSVCILRKWDEKVGRIARYTVRHSPNLAEFCWPIDQCHRQLTELYQQS